MLIFDSKPVLEHILGSINEGITMHSFQNVIDFFLDHLVLIEL